MVNLPWELIEEILFRVPATSLKRLGSTCKQWNALFENQRSPRSTLQSMVLLLNDLRVYPINVNLNDTGPSIEFKSALSFKDSDSNSEEIDITGVFHCDGLLLCTTDDNRLVVWNPCLRETRWINFKNVYRIISRFALGYQNNKSFRSYKILRFWRFDLTPSLLSGSEIYEFTSNSWKVLPDNLAPKHSILSGIGVSSKGNTYWLVSDKGTEFILSFDFTTERFKHFSLPATLNFCMMVLSVVRDEELSIVSHHKFGKPEKDIWIAKRNDSEAALSWKKSCTVEFKPYSNCFINRYCHSFVMDEEKNVVVGYCWVCIMREDNAYNIEVPFVESTSWLCHPFIFNYVPSLVQIQ
ncbi:hypothetical protein CARUB_v10016431mg [Capsella rubella]|uniref:F-box domain-containing protein n=1 Tax=Capsella rubella TaxID=81985 RepID=R0I9A5_9BRAS|nr:hypothetical protein CARUB_v10016431mg [Capsella rubella]